MIKLDLKKNIIAFIGLLITMIFISSFIIGCDNIKRPDFDFLKFSKERVLPCMHPTADTGNAVAEYTNPPKFNKKENMLTARVKVYYSGPLNRHNMILEIYFREGTPPMVKVIVLQDSADSQDWIQALTQKLIQCKYVGNWQEIDLRF